MSDSLSPRIGRASARTTMTIVIAVIVAWVLTGLWLAARKPDLVALAAAIPSDAPVGSCWGEIEDAPFEIDCDTEHLFEITDEGVITIFESD